MVWCKMSSDQVMKVELEKIERAQMPSPGLCAVSCKRTYSGDNIGEGQVVIRFPPTHLCPQPALAGALNIRGLQQETACSAHHTASTFTPSNMFKNLVRDKPRRLAYKSFCIFLCIYVASFLYMKVEEGVKDTDNLPHSGGVCRCK